jgi:Family of unknown function (DUF6204)
MSYSENVNEERIFRVTVRGRFFDLSQASRAYLSDAQDQHDVSRAEFTREGTLTYDSRVDFFSFRYEVRTRGIGADEVAAQVALGEVEQFMKTMGFGYRGLKVTVSDMSMVWATTFSPTKRCHSESTALSGRNPPRLTDDAPRVTRGVVRLSLI